MNKKYLPIGSVCTLKGKSKKVMITGFYSVGFNGNLRINDYCGCAYPEGLLLPETVCTFNHSDIEKVDFVGYKNDEQEKFEQLLNRLTNNVNENSEDDWVLASNKSYSKILFDENGVVVLAEPVVENVKKEKINFDENGIVISVGEQQENPFYKNYDSKEYPNNIVDNEDIFKKTEEGETLIDNKELDKQKKLLNQIEFDENGIVVAVKSEKPKERYKFDENGILISVVGDANEEVKNSEISDKPQTVVVNGFEFDENGNLISAPKPENNKPEDNSKHNPKYKFDENGIVISE